MTIKPLKKLPDERGYFSEIFRADWSDLFEEDTIRQANLSISYPNIVRAWHKHEQGQIDYFVALKGAIKICAFDDESQELDEIISTGENLQSVKVLGKYWHGFRVIGYKPAILVYFTNKLYNHSNPDELRRPWNDQAIIPTKINGNKDPRCGKPWDWFYPPFK